MSELRRNLKINGETYYLAVNQYGSGVPTASTPGKPGVLYMDTDTKILYKCTNVSDGATTWEIAFSGSGVNPVAKTDDLFQEVGVDEDGKLWTRFISGSVYVANVNTQGASSITVPLSDISLTDSRLVVTLGDKLITSDGYLYEVNQLTIGSVQSYKANLICALGGGSSSASEVPSYWQEELEAAAASINECITAAGCNKAAFLCYTDAHWTYNAQKSPMLLNYLHRHTAMNKVVFCGDIVDEEDDVSYLWQWREAIKDLPNHHSVVGNHDDGNTTNNLFDEKYVYGFLMAPEETPDVVRGDNGLYYYVDNHSERTRYLYLDTAFMGVTEDQRTFVDNALKTTPDKWHIVAAAHIWHDADYTASPVTVGDINTQAKIFLDMFDAYNQRSGDYAACDGWVEFCIGGHTHMDHYSLSESGIPIVLICTDSMHTRSGTAYEANTTNESAVAGVIADYDEQKITVVGVGRASNRWILYNGRIDNGGSDGGTYTNILDTVGYTADMECSTTDGSEKASSNGYDLTGFIPLAANDVVRLKNIVMPDGVTDSRNHIYLYDANKGYIGHVECTTTDTTTGASNLKPVFENGNLVQFTNPAAPSWAYVRINAEQIDETSIITINEEIDGDSSDTGDDSGGGSGDDSGSGSGGESANYTNILDTVGYQADMEVSTSSGTERASSGGYDLTGFILLAPNDVVRLKNVIMPDNVTDRRNHIYLYDANKGYIGHLICSASDTTNGGYHLNPVFEDGNLVQFTNRENPDWTYIRINAQQIDETSIITINEEIV